MFSDIGGMRPATETKAQAVADLGYSVLLPNILYRSGRGQIVPVDRRFDDQDMLTELVECGRLLTPEALSRDFVGLVSAVEREPEFREGRIGTVGYCRGGGIAIRLAALYPDKVAAAAGFHSSNLADPNDPNSPMLVVNQVTALIYLGHADKDDYLPPEQISLFDRVLSENSAHFMTELYRGYRHGFTTLDTDAYSQKADILHLNRLRMVLGEALTD